MRFRDKFGNRPRPGLGGYIDGFSLRKVYTMWIIDFGLHIES